MQMEDAVPERLLTVEQVARDFLRIGRTRTFELVASGALRSVVIGRRSRRVPESAIAEFVHRLQVEQ
ncbi:MAG: hypothetical protein QOF51_2179, partial [Chloroflexota bacterium]|nr:hypothetical protein [Chloroflexota bacterium]